MKQKAAKKQKRAAKKVDPSELPGARVKLTFRKHILPPLMGLGMMIGVLGFFNSQYIVATLSDWTYKAPAAAATLDNDLASRPVDVNAPAKVIINSIAVEAPVIYDQTTINEANFQKALRDGVVHYPFTSVPGQPGNVVIFGHSSGQAWAPGNYKFVFTHLEQVQPGQKVFLEYKGIRYIYEINDKKVVAPTEVSVLNPTAENTLTLITCVPVGTNKNRLIVTAKQIVPKPDTSEPTATPRTELETLPGTVNPSLWDSIKNWF